MEQSELQTTSRCKNCGAVLQAGQNFCQKCGAPRGTPKANICENCGAELQDGQKFCTKCGTPRTVHSANYCGNCGAKLQDGQKFCTKCGQQALQALVPGGSSVMTVQPVMNPADEVKKSRKKEIIITVIVAVAVVVAAALLIPKLFVSVDKLCAQGNYSKAYEKSDDTAEKLQIKIESIAAAESAVAADNLNDPYSFELRNAYYREEISDDGSRIAVLILYALGSNSYGANVSNYFMFMWDGEENEWKYVDWVADLEEEDYSYYDDYDEYEQKKLDNAVREVAEDVMDEGTELNKDAVQRINKLYASDALDEVVPIDVE